MPVYGASTELSRQHDLNRRPMAATDPLNQLAAALRQDYAGTGIGVVGGEYSGNSPGAIRAQWSVIFSHLISPAGGNYEETMAEQACILAANARLQEIGILDMVVEGDLR